MIKRSFILLSIIFITALSFVNLGNKEVNASSVSSSIQNIKLDLNPTETDNVLLSDTFKRGNERHFGKRLDHANKKDGELNLKFQFGQDVDDGTAITGNGRIRINGNDTVSLTFNDILRKTTIDGKKIYFGPVVAGAYSKSGNTQSVLGIYFDPETNESVVSATIGEIGSDDGDAVAVFGEISPSYLKAADQVKNIAIANKTSTSNATLAELTDHNVAHADTVTLSTQFNYKTSVSTGGLAKTDYSDGTGSPTYQPYDVFGMNVYAREVDLAGPGTAMVYVRGWSNTQQVVEYMKGNPPTPDYYGNTQWNASLWYLYMGAGNSNLMLNMDQNLTTPKDSDTIKAYKVPIKGTYGSIVNVIFSAFAQYQNYTKPITTTNKVYAINGSWLAYAEKRISELDKLADLPYRQDYVSNEVNNNGGVGVQFYFNEQVDGTQTMYVKGRAVYLAGSNYASAICWYVTPQIQTSYSHKFQ